MLSDVVWSKGAAGGKGGGRGPGAGDDINTGTAHAVDPGVSVKNVGKLASKSKL